MKKFLLVFLMLISVFCLCFGFAACDKENGVVGGTQERPDEGSGSQGGEQNPDKPDEPEKPVQIEVKVYIDHELKETLYTDSTKDNRIVLPQKPEDMTSDPNLLNYFDGWYADEKYTKELTGEETYFTSSAIYGRNITENSNDFRYTVEDGKVTIQGLKNRTDTKIVVPRCIDSYPVTAIGNEAFYKCDFLQKIILPSSLTSIKYSAFQYCSSLRSIEIPESVTSIGRKAFYYCYSLRSIEIPDGVTSIGEEVFWSCSSLQSIEIPDGVTSIGGEAFRDCSSLQSIKIPDGVTSIGSSAFMDCSSLQSIEIPASVTSIGSRVVDGCCELTEIKVDSGNERFFAKDNCLIARESRTLIAGCKTSIIPNDGSVTSIGENAFEGCSTLQSIEIPDSVTSIGGSAFACCSSLQSIEIPASVTSIGGGAFWWCSSLQRVLFGENSKLTTIGGGAFYRCFRLQSIEIPDSVTSIGKTAFNDCRALTEIRYTGTIDAWKCLEKESGWDSTTGDYTVYCTDGTIGKNGTETRY